MYKGLLRPLLYSLPPEKAHYLTAGLLATAAQIIGVRSIIQKSFELNDKSLEREVFGLKFPNPVGLAAGFDKDARWIEALELLGFGFIEIGTLTPKAQHGNEKPRLFRLEKDEALINRMGFNNDGVDAAVERIKQANRKTPLGGNIGKNKLTSQADAPKDYLVSFEKLYDHVDYFAVNVSSPNTPGLRELQGKDELKKIFDGLLDFRERQKSTKPVALKIAPDLNPHQIEDIVTLVKELNIDAIIATNTTISRSGLKSNEMLLQQTGGLSGKPVKEASTSVIKQIKSLSNGDIPIIGVGGIHNPEDAIEKMEAGASLVQLYTGFIYEGPSLVKRIKKSLIKK
jgi:dihydroorotate dehydrogenase